MFLPEQYLWFEPVLVAAVVVFVVSWIGNSLTFSNKFANALVTAVVFALIFGAITYFGYGNIKMSVSSQPAADAPAAKAKAKQP